MRDEECNWKEDLAKIHTERHAFLHRLIMCNPSSPTRVPYETSQKTNAQGAFRGLK